MLRYHHLVCNFDIDKEIELELPFTDEELEEKYDGALTKEMGGQEFDVLSKMLKVNFNDVMRWSKFYDMYFQVITGKKLTMPGKFVGHSGTPALSCSYKTASGYMYPLERGFIFLYKPPVYIRYDEVMVVDFQRSGGSTRY